MSGMLRIVQQAELVDQNLLMSSPWMTVKLLLRSIVKIFEHWLKIQLLMNVRATQHMKYIYVHRTHAM
jgi:hypothetical protein